MSNQCPQINFMRQLSLGLLRFIVVLSANDSTWKKVKINLQFMSLSSANNEEIVRYFFNLISAGAWPGCQRSQAFIGEDVER